MGQTVRRADDEQGEGLLYHDMDLPARSQRRPREGGTRPASSCPMIGAAWLDALHNEPAARDGKPLSRQKGYYELVGLG